MLQTPDLAGLLRNSISGGVNLRDAAFTANVFSTHARAFKMPDHYNRAECAIRALQKENIFAGIEEPIWNRFGWHTRKGSLAATGLLIDALYDATRRTGRIEEVFREECTANIKRYLDSCYISNGRFAHDSIVARSVPPAVQNTTAMALYLMVLILELGQEADRNGLEGLAQRLEQTLRALKHGQRNDGFWPYIYPGLRQILFDRSRCIRFGSRVLGCRKFFVKNGDRSVYFGDFVHHLLVLQFILKTFEMRVGLEDIGRPCIEGGWNWVEGMLIEYSRDSIKIDFSHEPRIDSPRYCNFMETSSYFLILSLLPGLIRCGFVRKERLEVGEKLMNHVQNCLLQNKHPAIVPYEASNEEARQILPRVGESVAWKGSAMCEFIDFLARTGAN